MATAKGEEERTGRIGELAGDAAELGGIPVRAGASAPVDTRREERLANPDAAEDEEEDELEAAGLQGDRQEALSASPEAQADEAERIRTFTTVFPDEERSVEEPKKEG